MKSAVIKLSFIALAATGVYRFSSGPVSGTKAVPERVSVTEPAGISLHPAPAGCTSEDTGYQRFQRLVSVWQKRDGLEQWNLDLSLVHADGLTAQTVGEVNWWDQPGTARIRILCPEDLKTVYGYTRSEIPRENEGTVVHELMHIVLGRLGGGRWEWPEAEHARIEDVTETLAQMLLNRRVPGRLSEAQYINRQIDSGPWNPKPEAKKQVMLQIMRAMHAASEDDVTALLARN